MSAAISTAVRKQMSDPWPERVWAAAAAPRICPAWRRVIISKVYAGCLVENHRGGGTEPAWLGILIDMTHLFNSMGVAHGVHYSWPGGSSHEKANCNLDTGRWLIVRAT